MQIPYDKDVAFKMFSRQDVDLVKARKFILNEESLRLLVFSYYNFYLPFIMNILEIKKLKRHLASQQT